jgi:hypothetical protein
LPKTIKPYLLELKLTKIPQKPKIIAPSKYKSGIRLVDEKEKWYNPTPKSTTPTTAAYFLGLVISPLIIAF